MKLKEGYRNLKERVKDYFGISEKLTQDQLNYILSGISKDILEKYKIVYSPNFILFNPDPIGTTVKNSLERKLEDEEINLDKDLSKKDYLVYLTNLKKDIKKRHSRNMETLRLNHLRKLNKLYSSVVETYSKGLDDLRKIFIENRRDGRLKIQFS